MPKAKKSISHPKANNSQSGKMDMDIETDDDVKEFETNMTNFPVMLVFIHADWCGHCQTFKPTWEEYKGTQGRKIPMIRVNEKVLSKTPFSNAKIDGFPSNVIFSPKDNSFAKFNKENGEVTNSIPNIRDKPSMIKLLVTDPTKLMPNSSEQNEDSLVSTPEMKHKLTNSGKKAIKKIHAPIKKLSMESIHPPNIAEDTVNAEPPRKIGVGGSMFESIIRGIKGFGEPTRRKKRKRSKGTRKSATL